MQRAMLSLGVVLMLSWGILGCVVSVGRGSHRWEDTLTYDESPSGIASLTIHTSNGGIRVEAWDSGSIGIEARRTVRSDDEDSGYDYAQSFVPKISRDGSRLTIDTPIPGGSTSAHIRQLTMDYRVMVPEELNVVADSDNGGIRVAGIRADADLETRNGAIDVTDVRGSIDALTHNGAIEMRDVQGSVDALTHNGALQLDEVDAVGSARTKNGSVRVSVARIEGETVVSTENGAIEIDISDGIDAKFEATTRRGAIAVRTPRIAAPTSLDTSSGAIEVTVRQELDAPLTATTSMGAVEARLPRNAGFDLSASTNLGTISTDWQRPEGSGRSLQMSVNGGGPRVELRTNLGAVYVRALD
ncbi:hypothetical protein FJZ36_04810 [Candidatus Poribacteria bacterium]|nr:hypothetical protein [Candidatus Poribacteria bacterium]